MNTVPAISIITPVWNGLPYVKECIGSVLNQEFQNWELLIGDNGSTDGTREFLDTLSDPRIQIFKHDVNRGIFGNLNFLFSNAKAPIAYILCADDYFLQKALDNVLQEWKRVTPKTAFIAFNSKESMDYSKLMRYSHSVLPQNPDPKFARLAFFLFGNFTGNLSNLSVKIDVLRRAGEFAVELRSAGDFEMWSRLAKHHDIALSNVKIAFVRRHKGVASNYLNYKGEQFPQHVAIFTDLIDSLTPYYNRKKLIDYFNLGICTFHFRRAVKAALFGRLSYMKVMLRTESPIVWPQWKKLFLCIPLSLSENGRELLTVYLAKGFIGKNKIEI
jgi:glycosyltransferase involved in cell wall biosynthesis